MPTKIDDKKCRACGECIDVCPVSPAVYTMILNNKKKKIVIKNPQSCIDCGACISACPESAIKRQD